MPIYSYQKISSNTLTIRTDPELGVLYVKDYECVRNSQLLRECNLKFLKILIECGVIQMQQGYIVACKPYFTVQDVDTIVQRIQYHYQTGYFCDSDLHDDLFEQFDIVSPIKAYEADSTKAFMRQYGDQFPTAKRKTIDKESIYAKKGVKTFLENRSLVFCFYVFLRRCAILYRDTIYKQPFQMLLNTFNDPISLGYLKKNYLRVKSIKFVDDNWTSGLHEWLACKLTVEALKRSAGYYPHIAPRIDPAEGVITFPQGNTSSFIFSEFNWLDLQFLVRTPTKFIIFIHNLHGHPGAVSPNLYNALKNGKWEGSPEFHNTVNIYFENSLSIKQFMQCITGYYEQVLLHPLQNLNPAYFQLPNLEQNYLSDGRKTNDYNDVTFFKQNKLKNPHDNIRTWLQELLIQIDINTLQEGEHMTYAFQENNPLAVANIKNNPTYRFETLPQVIFHH